MTLESKLFFDDGESSWEGVWPGIERKIIGYDERLMMVQVKFEKGAEAPAHQHPHSQTSWIVSGEFECNLGEDKRILGAGDGFYVPPGVQHSVVAREAGIIVDAFSPHREDFLT